MKEGLRPEGLDDDSGESMRLYGFRLFLRQRVAKARDDLDVLMKPSNRRTEDVDLLRGVRPLDPSRSGFGGRSPSVGDFMKEVPKGKHSHSSSEWPDRPPRRPRRDSLRPFTCGKRTGILSDERGCRRSGPQDFPGTHHFDMNHPHSRTPPWYV